MTTTPSAARLAGALAAIIADPDCCKASKSIARDGLKGAPSSYCIVPRRPSFEMKLAGAAAITKDMMDKSANYDAAIACWEAMVATIGWEAMSGAEVALKPCPFCGSRPARGFGHGPGQASFSGVELNTLVEGGYRVWCGTCGTEGPFEIDKNEAIAVWNTRAA